MGGDPNAITLPNLIKVFSPNVTGASVGDHLFELCYGKLCLPFQYYPQNDRLNAAQSGAMVSNIEHEVDYLVRQMELNSQIDMENDFKVTF